jgi:chromosome partitioning protein
MPQAKIVVIGNEKGGAGKTTISVHFIIYLLKIGFKVAIIDLDLRQKTLTRYMQNRANYSSQIDKSIDIPNVLNFSLNNNSDINLKNQNDQESFEVMVQENIEKFDYIVIDTPGSSTFLSDLAHSYADIIITPLNDSFLDLDVIAQVDLEIENIKPSIYSESIWRQKLIRAKRNKGEIKWVVLRNRLSSIDAINKRKMAMALEKIAKKLGFKLLEGFTERVIFKELFLYGLTLLDLDDEIAGIKLTYSHLAAKQELKSFLLSLDIDDLNLKLENSN